MISVSSNRVCRSLIFWSEVSEFGSEEESSSIVGASLWRFSPSSEAVICNAFQSSLGRMLMSSFGLSSMVLEASSTDLGWRVLVEVCLQVLTAHVRKLRVRIFILI